jgi:Arc/MetJ-type ribon-helix-helix transcriptional regulator
VNVQLSEESRRFIADQVATGRYPSEDAVLEDAVSRLRQQEQPPQSGRTPDQGPLWGLFRDEPELIEQIVEDAMRDRRTLPLRATAVALLRTFSPMRG